MVTATYPAAKHAAATGTVQSRSPSEIWSASGPWPDTELPTRWPIRHVDQTASSVSSRGTAVTAVPCTRIPDPWAISQPSAPTRSASRGAPWLAASLRNQPVTAAPRQTVRRAPAAATPPRHATSSNGLR